jgi:hypothetical protein
MSPSCPRVRAMEAGMRHPVSPVFVQEAGFEGATVRFAFLHQPVRPGASEHAAPVSDAQARARRSPEPLTNARACWGAPARHLLLRRHVPAAARTACSRPSRSGHAGSSRPALAAADATLARGFTSAIPKMHL